MKKKSQRNRGMTYIELIVVLSIFAVISSMVIFNYGDFQARVDIKNLASDIALQIVQAQKSSLSGLLPSLSGYDSTWKPSYGVYFSSSVSPDSRGADNKDFIYFADLGNATLPQNGIFDGSGSTCTGECLNKITITKNDNISSLNVFYQNDSTPHNLSDLTITFERPNSGAVLVSGSAKLSGASYVQINIVSPNKSVTASIKLYPSGRVQVN
jgi:prepilin-type N-terminal cleavage/methylation domain-containing protein